MTVRASGFASSVSLKVACAGGLTLPTFHCKHLRPSNLQYFSTTACLTRPTSPNPGVKLVDTDSLIRLFAVEEVHRSSSTAGNHLAVLSPRLSGSPPTPDNPT